MLNARPRQRTQPNLHNHLILPGSYLAYGSQIDKWMDHYVTWHASLGHRFRVVRFAHCTQLSSKQVNEGSLHDKLVSSAQTET